MNAVRRIQSLRARLADAGYGAAVVTDPVNVAYLTGFEGVFDDEDAHAAVVTASDTVLYTDTRYAEACTRAAEGTTWQVRVARENLYITLCADLAAEGIGSLTLEESVPFGRFRFVSEQFDGNVEAVDGWVEEIRQVKVAEEIERIAAAQQLTDAAFDHILGYIAAGRTEREISLEIEFFMRKHGSEGVAFAAIIASGPNSALPHAKVTDRAVEPGDFLKMDFGARMGGYCADMTRTVVVGKAGDRQREIYDTVLAANLAGIAAVRPGVPGRDIDAAARAVIVERGFGEAFGHGLGHGVGMAVHELPSVGPRGAKSVLSGSVITIEPGVYLPGFGGVRIEDLVVVEEGGARVLTRSTKDLLEL